jgi:BTB/POZ domain
VLSIYPTQIKFCFRRLVQVRRKSESTTAMAKIEDVFEDGTLKVESLKFTWKIPQFGRFCTVGDVRSPVFSALGVPVKLMLCIKPMFIRDNKPSSQSINGPESWMDLNWMALSIQTEGGHEYDFKHNFELAILDENGEKFVSKNVLNPLGTWMVRDKFIHNRVLRNPLNKLLPNGTLTVLCQIQASIPEAFQEKALANQRCLVEDFGSLLDNKNSADVQFLLKQCKIGAHKIILSARSPVFGAMFQHNM